MFRGSYLVVHINNLVLKIKWKRERSQKNLDFSKFYGSIYTLLDIHVNYFQIEINIWGKARGNAEYISGCASANSNHDDSAFPKCDDTPATNSNFWNSSPTIWSPQRLKSASFSLRVSGAYYPGCIAKVPYLRATFSVAMPSEIQVR
jgi:hypothetical protein